MSTFVHLRGGGTLLPFEVKVAIKDMIFLIFQKWCKAIPVVFWKYLMMYLGQFRYTMNNQPIILLHAKITKPFTNYDLKFSFWDHYFRWSKVVKLGPIHNQTYEMSKATFVHFSRFYLLLWSLETFNFYNSNIFSK